MGNKSYRDASRENWTNRFELTNEDINTGSLQRIADATEVMAKNHNELIRENDSLKREVERYRLWYNQEQKLNRYLRGNITRLKNKLKKP
ncbi:MAG: hypothetical protein V4651_08520 [Bacteroidota bacterium]